MLPKFQVTWYFSVVEIIDLILLIKKETDYIIFSLTFVFWVEGRKPPQNRRKTNKQKN